MYPESEHEEPGVSTSEAADYIHKVKQRDTRGLGDDDNALRRFARAAGLSYWTVRRIDHGQAKTVNGDVLRKVRLAYLRYCERLIISLQAELEAEAAIEAKDADLAGLLAETEKLAAKAAQAKERLTRRGLK